MTNNARLEKVSVARSPTQAVIAWMTEAHAYPTFTAYASSLIGQPDAAYPLVRMPEQVEQATRRALKGEPQERVARAVRQAVRDVHFLYAIHQQVNVRLLDAQGLLHVRLQTLLEGYQQLLVEEVLVTQVTYLQSRSRRRTRDDLALPSRAQPEGRLSRVRRWRNHALESLGALYTHRAVATQLAQRYFNGQALLFPAAASYLTGLIERTERLVTVFNEGLGAVCCAPLPEDELASASLCPDLEAVAQSQQATIAVALQGLVQQAQAQALDEIGERRAAHALVARRLVYETDPDA